MPSLVSPYSSCTDSNTSMKSHSCRSSLPPPCPSSWRARRRRRSGFLARVPVDQLVEDPVPPVPHPLSLATRRPHENASCRRGEARISEDA
ncbi:hypothetical protein PVAP13_7KG129255 [Panicum virgatum]|uniref:Uncharacterized protein n=1 Tax=Panicum virgatum TaxID=38727 RepID=A0A8T0QLZ4_PANVG|nr:hypothetical protein PVAP13_7KG129255 [Panicum virgatum]